MLSAFFDALAAEVGKQLAALELTDDEKCLLGTGAKHPLRDHFTDPATPMPGPLCGFAEKPPAVDEALALYAERYARLAADVPEFGIWSQLDEHAATRAEVRKQTGTLVHLTDLLSETVRSVNTPAAEAEQRLARQAAQVLQRCSPRSSPRACPPTRSRRSAYRCAGGRPGRRDPQAARQ